MKLQSRPQRLKALLHRNFYGMPEGMPRYEPTAIRAVRRSLGGGGSSFALASAIADLQWRQPLREDLRDDRHPAQSPAVRGQHRAGLSPSLRPGAARSYRYRSEAGTSHSEIATLHSCRAQPRPAPGPHRLEERDLRSPVVLKYRSKEYPPESPGCSPLRALCKTQLPCRWRRFLRSCRR